MLVCPTCRKSLKPRLLENSYHYDCPNGHGRAVALPVLRKSVAPSVLKDLVSQSLDDATPEGVSCPACFAKTREATLDVRGAPLHVDVCRHCHFVWFDPKELEQLPQKPPPPPTLEEQLPPEAREEIAVAEVEQMAEDAHALDEDKTWSINPGHKWKWVPGLLGMPVERLNDAHPLRPWLTWIVAIICILATVVDLYLVPLSDRFGMVPQNMERYFGLTFVTAFFLHGGWLHLISNLYFLMIFGDNVEVVLGRWRYFLLLAVASAAGFALHVAVEPRSDLPLIGASAGISGVLVFYALQFPRARLGFMLLPPIPLWLFIPAWLALFFWIGLQTLDVSMQLSGMTNVSAISHVGGAVIGLIFWIGLRMALSRQESKWSKDS